jgi:hypothetical protein
MSETETDCEKCFICEEFDTDVQVVVFEHTVNVVYGNFQMVTFVTCVIVMVIVEKLVE